MITTFTENDLVRFLYGELNENEKNELEQALITDNDLQSKLNDLQLVKSDLDQVQFSPSQRSIDKILEFSKGYHTESV